MGIIIIIIISGDFLKKDVDVVKLRAQADASMPASNNNNVNSHYIL